MQLIPVFLPGESQGWGSLVGYRIWVAKSQTQLKQLSSSSNSIMPYVRSSELIIVNIFYSVGHIFVHAVCFYFSLAQSEL